MVRILIVDDNESIHTDFKKVLAGHTEDRLRSVEMELFGEDDSSSGSDELGMDYDLDHAYQGEEAVSMVDAAAAEGNPYALIFMDVRMPPGMDGVRATAEIWKNHPNLEVVICTAHSDYSWNQMLDEIGATDKLQFIRKPFDMVTVQQLALSLTKKTELSLQTENYIRRLEVEMSQKEEAQNALRTLNEELEARITERTAALETANQSLKQTVLDLQEAQKALVESEKMASLGGLVAGVAHEINTPVGVGVTAASHLSQKTKALHELFESQKMKKSDLVTYLETSAEAADMILTNLERASQLIQSFKKVAVDQSSEEKRSFSVVSYIEEVLVSLRPKLKKTRHQVHVEGDKNLILDSFPGAFAQIVSNLVINSLIHAFDEEDSGDMRFHVAAEGERIIIEYRDNGAGMSEEIQNKIFDPFFTTKRGQGGSGLGMHIVYNIVTQTMGGSIQCRSELGHGVRFKLTFPRVAKTGGQA